MLWLTRLRFQLENTMRNPVFPFMLHVNMEDNLRVVFVCDELLAGVAAQPPAGPTGGVIPPGYERSFRQALRRLATTGCTTYKGRMLMHIFFTSDNWCCSQPGVQDLTTSWRIDQSWTAGRLTDATWQKLMLYVTGHNIDIVFRAPVSFGGSLVRNARFGDLARDFWRKSRTKRSFWRLDM